MAFSQLHDDILKYIDKSNFIEFLLVAHVSPAEKRSIVLKFGEDLLVELSYKASCDDRGQSHVFNSLTGPFQKSFTSDAALATGSGVCIDLVNKSQLSKAESILKLPLHAAEEKSRVKKMLLQISLIQFHPQDCSSFHLERCDIFVLKATGIIRDIEETLLKKNDNYKEGYFEENQENLAREQVLKTKKQEERKEAIAVGAGVGAALVGAGLAAYGLYKLFSQGSSSSKSKK